ncbi:retrovirus-related Pol polyprotein from transposon 17.6 [Nephila pilipes]|uniref:Retrovirus-related Pol polyprotein from transposon 17.6 n=1 Tax=Nephila pilipes TaxID=299642 RepID=A0A8X6QA77_NEPPI|nr:retrovirus-related Pol polyprotein from transposon 17.6 [Nephila pilipes]
MEDVIKRTAGKRYNSKMDIKSAFNTIRIRETDIYKTGFVTPYGHFEFLRMLFGVTNGPSTMTRAIKLAYNHLAPHNVNTYIDDISTSHDNFRYHLKVLYKIFEATRNAGFKLTPAKSQFAFSEISLFGRNLFQESESPDAERTASVDRYSTLKSIQEVRSFLRFTNQFRKYIRNYAVIAKPLTNSLKGLEKKTSNAAIALTDDQ